jgi:AAA domain, putative AbiEii toxin, Type IV TA system/AAA ATPase domain
MRLLNVEIEQFRSIEDQRIPMDGLTVLFGPNSAGKTSVLEVVEHLLAQEREYRSDPGDDDNAVVLGSVMFDLPAASIANSDDALLYQALLRGEYNKAGLFGAPEDPWAWLQDGLGERLKDADLDGALSLLAESLARSSAVGSREDRDILARAVFYPEAVYFWADLSNVSLNADLELLPSAARDAASRIAAIAGDDPLCTLATHLVSEGWTHIAWLGAGTYSSPEGLQARFPPAIVLDGDLGGLSGELESAIVAVHDRIWHIEPKVLESFPGGGEMLEGAPDFGIGKHALDDRYVIDQWLEAQSEEGDSVPAEIFDRYDQNDWYRVRRSVLAAAEVIEAEANRVAPDFVKNQGTIGIDVLPVAVWGSGGHRVRATFTEFGRDKHDLKVVGAGTGRWAAAAIRLASRRLANGRQVVRDDTCTDVDDEDERRRIVTEAYRAPSTQTAVQLVPSDSPTVYIADEPEAHLHPAALRSVREWLSLLAETAATVLIATHSTALLDSTSGLIHRVLVLRTPEGTVLREMTGALDDELARVSDTLGLSKGELLLMARLALFVEGPHDQMILNEWFGDELRAAGIHIFPAGGADNLPGLITSELATALGIRIATLTDDTSVPRAVSGNPQTRGEKAVARLAREAAQAGAMVYAAGLSKGDILWYLDDKICRQAAPKFPGWDTAMSEYTNAETHAPWKRWIKERYGLPLSRDGIRGLARECRNNHKIPQELAQKIKSLIVYASSSDPDGHSHLSRNGD